jgi:hypothetical protein
MLQGMAAQDPRVPVEVEDYLIALFARAGQIGGLAGGAVSAGPAGAFGGGRGGARGGARAATRMKTKVEERSGNVPGTPDEVAARLAAAFPKAKPLPATGRLRLAVPIGITGLQQIIIDLDLDLAQAGPGSVQALLRGYGKEGLLSAHPTLKTVDIAWSAIQSGAS